MRRLILNVHLVIALLAGVFIVLLAVTGSIIAFEPELDRLLHPDVSYVKPGGRSLSLVEMGDVVSRQYGGDAIVAYLPSDSPHLPTQVILSGGIVSINQYTGEVLGMRTRGQTFLGVVRALHVRLAVGDVGRSILKWSAVGMIFSLASGLYLWWPIKRVRIRGPLWSRSFWFDLHNTIGICSLLPLLVLAGTGTVIGFEDEVASLLDRLAGTRSAQTESLSRSELHAGSLQITPDEAVAIASAQLPGAVPYRVQMPRFGGFYVVALAYTDNRIAGERNSIAVDPWNGKIISESLATNLTMRERVMAMNETIHTGNVLGMPSRIMVVLASILLLIQAGSGLVMWLRRTRITRPD